MKRKETEREKEFGCLCKVEEEEEIVYMGTHQSFADQDFHEEDEELSFQNGQQPQSCVSEESVSKMNVKEEVEEEQSEGEESQKYGGEEEEPPLVNANAIGGPLRVSGEGRKKKYHYKAFEFDGTQYELEDFVLVAPDKIDDKPHVAVIKDITQGKNGCVMVTTQWFYRPKEVEREGNGRWNACDARALFYSFHVDEISAESVMHKCVVHFVPMHKKIPKRTEHPGFIVQRVYDHREERLYKLTDGDYKGNKQNEIDLLLHKTWSLLGDLPDIVTEEAPLNQEHGCDISREEEETSKPDQHLKAAMAESLITNASEYYCILEKFKALTGEIHRDKWLERLLQGVQYMCSSGNNIQSNNSFGTETKIQEKSQKGRESFTWPDDVVPAIAALEKASHLALSSDFHKYNQRLQKLLFNLKINPLLTQCLLNGELDPKKIFEMTPDELKKGLTSEEIVKETVKKELDESEGMQMVDVRCLHGI